MKTLMLVKPGFLKAKDRKMAEANGFLVVETEDFAAFKLVDPVLPLEREKIFRAAMYAIATTDSSQGPKTRFGEQLAKLLMEKPDVV